MEVQVASKGVRKSSRDPKDFGAYVFRPGVLVLRISGRTQIVQGAKKDATLEVQVLRENVARIASPRRALAICRVAGARGSGLRK